MDEQMIARALAECAERNGFAESVPLGAYSMFARAAHSVIAGKVAELMDRSVSCFDIYVRRMVTEGRVPAADADEHRELFRAALAPYPERRSE